MMKAIINGIEVTGTPQEIWDYQQRVNRAQEIKELRDKLDIRMHQLAMMAPAKFVYVDND